MQHCHRKTNKNKIWKWINTNKVYTAQAHLRHKINGNKIHDDEKTTRSNVIKTDKVLEDGQPQRHLCCGPPARYLPPAANSNKKKTSLPPTFFRLRQKIKRDSCFFEKHHSKASMWSIVLGSSSCSIIVPAELWMNVYHKLLLRRSPVSFLNGMLKSLLAEVKAASL